MGWAGHLVHKVGTSQIWLDLFKFSGINVHVHEKHLKYILIRDVQFSALYIALITMLFGILSIIILIGYGSVLLTFDVDS